jgi:hypothetical protein
VAVVARAAGIAERRHRTRPLRPAPSQNLSPPHPEHFENTTWAFLRLKICVHLCPSMAKNSALANFPSKTQCLLSKTILSRLIIPFAHAGFLIFHPPKTNFVSQKQKIFKKSANLFLRNKPVFRVSVMLIP